MKEYHVKELGVKTLGSNLKKKILPKEDRFSNKRVAEEKNHDQNVSVELHTST